MIQEIIMNLIDQRDIPGNDRIKWDNILSEIPKGKALVITKNTRTAVHFIRQIVNKKIKADSRYYNFRVLCRDKTAYIINQS